MKTTNTIRTNIEYLEKQRKNYLKRQKAYKPLRKLIQFLKVTCAIIAIIAAATFFLFPPVGAVCTGICLILWFIISQLEKKKMPALRYQNEIMHKVLPEIIHSWNENFKVVSTFDNYRLKQSQLIDKNILAKTSNLLAKPNIQGKVNDVDFEMADVHLLQKKINYKKSSVGCITAVFLFPFYIWRTLINDYHSADQQEDESIFYREEELFQNLFFGSAHFPSLFPHTFYLIPESYSLTEITNKQQLYVLETNDKFLKEHYLIYGSDESLLGIFLNDGLLGRIKAYHIENQALIALSFKQNALSVLTPLSHPLLNTDLNRSLENTPYFDPLLDHISFFKNYVNEVNQQILKHIERDEV